MAFDLLKHLKPVNKVKLLNGQKQKQKKRKEVLNRTLNHNYIKKLLNTTTNYLETS